MSFAAIEAVDFPLAALRRLEAFPPDAPVALLSGESRKAVVTMATESARTAGVAAVMAACASAGGLHRDHDVAEKNPIAGRIGLAGKLLHVKAQHVGGAIETTKLAIERTDLVIAGEHQSCRRARAP